MGTEPIMAAAIAGDINRLYELIRHDYKVLDKFGGETFSETPLHAAAKAGQTLFAMELMNLKPSHARKLDPDGYSPLHLALQKALHSGDDDTRKLCTLMVIQFVKADEDLVRVRGKEGYTPFLFIVQHGGQDDMDLLINFLMACHECMDDVTIRGETALHIAVKRDNFDIFEILVGWLTRICSDEDKDMQTRILNWQDHNGDTILHLAASNIIHRLQFVKTLLKWGAHTGVKNRDGLTAAAILEESKKNLDEQSRKMLPSKLSYFAGAFRDFALSISPQKLPNKEILKSNTRVKCLSMFASESIRSALLVVVGLIATCTYQAVLDPPPALLSFNEHGSYGSNFWVVNGLLFCDSITITLLLVPKTIGPIVYFMLSYFSFCYVTCALAARKTPTNWAIQYVIFAITCISLSIAFAFKVLNRTITPSRFFRGRKKLSGLRLTV